MNLEVPVAVAVPEIVTELVVLELNVRPAGRSPEVRVQANVPVAPVALITAK